MLISYLSLSESDGCGMCLWAASRIRIWWKHSLLKEIGPRGATPNRGGMWASVKRKCKTMSNVTFYNVMLLVTINTQKNTNVLKYLFELQHKIGDK